MLSALGEHPERLGIAQARPRLKIGILGNAACRGIRHMLRWLAIILVVQAPLFGVGCTTSGRAEDRRPVPAFQPVRTEVDGLAAMLAGVLAPADTSSDIGWLEYELLLENRGDSPLAVSAVKLLTKSGRYLSPAASYAEILTPYNAAYEVAGSVASSAAGMAAGQVIPYGGLVVQAVASVAEASSAEGRARAEQRFRLRRVPGVELAAGGHMDGSAFFPRVPDPDALVIDFLQHGAVQRATLPLQ